MSVQCRRYGGIAEAQMQRKKTRCICVAAKARNGSKKPAKPSPDRQARSSSVPSGAVRDRPPASAKHFWRDIVQPLFISYI